MPASYPSTQPNDFASTQEHASVACAVHPGSAAETGAALELLVAVFGKLVSGLESRFLPLGANLCEVVAHLQNLVRVAEKGFAAYRDALADGVNEVLCPPHLRPAPALTAGLGMLPVPPAKVARLLARMRHAVERIENHRQAIDREAGSIVYYLQFGDLIRQQCEHIEAAMRDAAHAAAAPDDERMTLPFIVQTAVGQVDLVHRQIGTAHDRLATGYGALAVELQHLMECGRQLVGLQEDEAALIAGRAALGKLLVLSAAGADMLRRALAGLESLTELAAEVAGHGATLSGIHQQLPQVPQNASAAIEARLMERYTMQSERDAHRRAGGSEVAEDGGNDIELF